MKTISFLSLSIALLLTPVVAFAESAGSEPGQLIAIRSLGSQTVEIDLGLMTPLFSYGTDGSFSPGINLYEGGAARFKYSTYLDPIFSTGVLFSGSLCVGQNTFTNGDVYGMLDIGPHISATPRLGNFEFPLSLAPLANIMGYSSKTYFGFSVQASAGIFYDFTPTWAFGITATYWWVPELYPGPTPPSSQNRFGNFLEIGLSAIFNF